MLESNDLLSTKKILDELRPEKVSGIKTAEKQVNEINSVKEQVLKIDENLKRAVASLQENPSLFSRAALYWSHLATWKKITLGALLFGVAGIVGVLVHVIALFVFAVVGSLLYMMSSYLLNDHHENSKQSTAQLEQNITLLTGMFSATTLLLDNIGKQLNGALDEFKSENSKLASTVSELDEEIGQLNKEVAELATTKKDLDLTQKKLKDISDQYETLLRTFNDKVADFEKVELGFNEQITQLTGVNNVLKGTADQLATFAIKNESTQKAFLQQLDDFVKNGTGAFANLLTDFSRVANELKRTQAAIDRSLQGHEELLSTYHRELAQLQSNTPPSLTSVTTNGVFGPKKHRDEVTLSFVSGVMPVQ